VEAVALLAVADFVVGLQDVKGDSAIKAGLASLPLGVVLITVAGMGGPWPSGLVKHFHDDLRRRGGSCS
jgi:hypothetical protein